MKLYWFAIFFLFLLWITASNIYLEPVWWSILSPDRSTHTSLFEQISFVKVILFWIVFLTLKYALQKMNKSV
ncbi:hypothetical protein NCCP133_19850 [Cytobacillus sp. NCCP-133]|nr:hypothetical protein NCCP133_19850 [Cytobacillus sp. NCCP-133]